MKKDYITIGIDFGTTHSGVAWSYSRQPDRIQVVRDWKSKILFTSNVEKTPTQLFYGNIGDSANWGYDIGPDEKALRWFKLLILDEVDVPKAVFESSQFQEAQNLQKASGKSPTAIIACYLRRLWNHAIQAIEATLGHELIELCPFRVTVTVPAIWPHYAQTRMKMAIEAAGILGRRPCGDTTLRFVTEPEAAALATISDMSARSNIKIGDTVIICDAGGGTVDLISYVVTNTDPAEFEECVQGSGGLCGAIRLDSNFLKLIRRRVGDATWSDVTEPHKKMFLNHSWEHGIKPQFCNQDHEWFVRLPEGCDQVHPVTKKRTQQLQLTSAELHEVFKPITDEILDLVDAQNIAIQELYAKPAKYIVLVGGFGRSRFLFTLLKETYPETTVLQSQESGPWTAICRGAVIASESRDGTTNKQLAISNRIARKSYGVEYATPWEYTENSVEDRYFDEVTNKWMARGQMDWFIEKGEKVSSQTRVSRSFCRHFTTAIGSVAEDLYCSSQDEPPKRLADGAERLCTVTWNKTIPLESLPVETNALGKVYYELKYEIEMALDGPALEFTVYYEGERVAGKNVEVEFY